MMPVAELSYGLPWVAIRSLDRMLAVHPTLLVGVSFIVLALACAAHAWQHGRAHCLAFAGALVGGAANDVFFMVQRPFFNAQGSIMLTARRVNSALCVHIVLMYLPVAGAWRLSLTPLGQCAASALVGALLWWTWHATDAVVAERWLGVPYGSTLWTLVHGFSFHGLLHALALRRDLLRIRTAAAALVGLSLLGLFVAALMTPFQLHGLGRPDALSLALCVGALLVLVGRETRGLVRRRPRMRLLTHAVWKDAADRRLWRLASLHLALLFVASALGSPGLYTVLPLHILYGA